MNAEVYNLKWLVRPGYIPARCHMQIQKPDDEIGIIIAIPDKNPFLRLFGKYKYYQLYFFQDSQNNAFTAIINGFPKACPLGKDILKYSAKYNVKPMEKLLSFNSNKDLYDFAIFIKSLED